MADNVPKIRFPGFTEPWEQRKFKDLVFKSGKKNKKNLPYESFSITNESGFVSQNEQFENGGTMKDADKSMYIIVSPNSFAYNPARINVGSIGYQALGKNVIVSSLYEVFKTSHEVDDHFLWYWFKSDHFKRLVESLQEGGVRLYFYFDKLQKGELWLPPIEEQRKIGGYFKSVDNLITLHQRKLDDLKKLKSGLLQKMFPKAGETVPEVRFPEFTGDWEQRKLGEMASFAKGNGYTKADLSTEGKPIILYGRLYTDYETVFSSIDTRSGQKPGSLLSKGGEVVVPASGETADEIARASVVMPDGIILGGDLNVITPNQAINPVFLAIELSSGNLHKVLASKAQGKSVVHLHNSDLQTLDVVFPSLDEQSKIGLCFEEFDALITLHQRKSVTIKKLKSGLLRKMILTVESTLTDVFLPLFTIDWEQRKLGNLFFQTNETVNPKTSNLSLWSLTVESGLTPKPERYDRSAITKKEDQYKMVHPGEIVFNPMNMTIGAIGMNKNSFPIAVSGYYITMKESSSNNKTIDPCFFSEWMCSPNALKLYKNVATGSLIEKQRVQFSTFSKIRAMFPKYEEQKKIGQVFDALDDLITLHQRKLDDLKKLKQGLLQQMLV